MNYSRKNRSFFTAVLSLCLSVSVAAAGYAGRLYETPQGNLAIADLPQGQVIDSGIPLSRLPEWDAAQIQAGVTLDDPTDVTKAVEDFCS